METKSHSWITGLILLGLALVWSVLVFQTIPAGQGEGDVGPRAFPLLLGCILAALSVVLIVRSTLNSRDGDKVIPRDEDSAKGTKKKRLEIEIALSVFITVIGYGFLLQKTGFIIATVLVVVATMVIILKSTKPLLIASMAIGLSVGCWLVFGKFIGAYLPHGTWLSLG